MKDTAIHERLNLQFRAEIFNLLDRANFNTPNLIVFTPTGVSGTAGAISSTSTTARQVQFGRNCFGRRIACFRPSRGTNRRVLAYEISPGWHRMAVPARVRCIRHNALRENLGFVEFSR